MTPPLALLEAQQRLLELARPLGAETVPAELALGRYLWGDLTARRTQPAADLSAMDGYAVHEPLGGPWRIVGESAAGRPFGAHLQPGEAVRISTGALMPHGSIAVLLQEEAIRVGSDLAVAPDGEAAPRHIRRKGFDFASGDTVLKAGARVGPAQLALAVSAGLEAGGLKTGRLPRVAVIDNGDELAVSPGEWDDHRLPASNGAMIAAMVQPLSASVQRLGPVPDRREALAEALAAARDADVIVTSGGASVGDHDLVRPALEEWGASIDFWRVAMKPGKPLLVARKGSAFVLGLPGNPVSSYVTAFLFLLPLLRRLAGAGETLPIRFAAKTATALPPGCPRFELIRANLVGSTATALNQQDSSGLRALALANALIERPIGAPAAAVGDEVSVYWLQNGGMG